MSHDGRIRAVFLSLILVVSVVGVVPLATGVGSAQSTDLPDTATDAADDVYVYENGTAVLVFEDEAEETDLQLGVDMASGLSHALVETEGDYDENLTAESTMWLRPDQFSYDGMAGMSAPEELESLDVSATGETSETTSKFDMSATGTANDDYSEPTEYGSDLHSQSSGSLTVGPNSIQSDGTVTVEESGSIQGPTDLSVSVTEPESGDYTVDVDLSQPISNEFGVTQWSTETAAKQTVQQQYAAIARQLGGEATVKINSHSYTAPTDMEAGNVDVSFTIEYTGIDEGLEDVMAQQATNSQSSDLTETEARELAQTITDVDIETVDFDLSADEDGIETSWDVDLQDVSDASLGVMETVYGSEMVEETNETDALVNRSRTMLEARQSADLETTYEWDVSVDRTLDENEDGLYEGAETEVAVELTSENENWEAYANELQERDIDVGSMSFDVTATSSGEEIDAEAEFEVGQEEMVQTAIDAMAAQLEADDTVDEDTQQLVEALEESEFEVARMDLDVENEQVIIEAGAKFDSYRQFLPEDMEYDTSSVTGRTENETSEVYVVAENFVSENQSATAASLSSYDVVDEDETNVHAPGEWDRSFPTMDKEQAREYLDLDAQTQGTSEGGAPGFTAAISLFAAVIAGMVALRRWN